MPEQPRTEVERFNNVVFVAILGALVLSFFDDDPILLGAELACRIVVIGLFFVALVRFRGDYFSHWTSWLTGVIAALSVSRILQLFLVG